MLIESLWMTQPLRVPHLPTTHFDNLCRTNAENFLISRELSVRQIQEDPDFLLCDLAGPNDFLLSFHLFFSFKVEVMNDVFENIYHNRYSTRASLILLIDSFIRSAHTEGTL